MMTPSKGVGMNVTLKGLVSRRDLNGGAGSVLNYDAEKNRWQIGFDGTTAIVYGN